MKSLGKSVKYMVAVCATVTVGFAASRMAGQINPTASRFLFVNDNNSQAANTVEGFSVASTGALTALPGSPFSTGGTGTTLGNPYGYNMIVDHNRFLYAVNSGSEDVSAFSVDTTTGIPTPLGPPVSANVSAGNASIGITLTPDGKTLYTFGGGSLSVGALRVGPTGALKSATGANLTGFPDGAAVTSDGKFLLVTQTIPDAINVFSIGSDGKIAQVPGSPFQSSGSGAPTEIAVDCASQRVFIGDSDLYRPGSVEVYNIDSTGTLTAVLGSPFRPRTNNGLGTAGLTLSTDGTLLYVSNPGSSSVTTFRILPKGGLVTLPGDPFIVSGLPNHQPGGVAFDAGGPFVFVGTQRRPTSGVSVFAATGQGTLTLISGSPFPTIASSEPYALTLMPGKACP